MPPAITAPQDRAYLGVIQLTVNATDLVHRIFSVHETIPVASSGPMVLLYPAWLPGNHSPSGPVQEVSGLGFHAGGKVLPWTRDPVDMFAFHVDVPQGVPTIEADFQRVRPVDSSIGRITITDRMLDLQWNDLVLCPAGYFSRDITFEAALRLPSGWQMGTGLEPRGHRH